MFESIIEHLDRDVELDEEELGTPLTLNVLGDVVRVQDLVEVEVPGAAGRRTVRADRAAGDADRVGPPGRR